MNSDKKKEADDVIIRHIRESDAEHVFEVVNWAYRGKPSGDTEKSVGWTHEMHLVKGPRITLDGLKKMIKKCKDPTKETILVAERRTATEPLSPGSNRKRKTAEKETDAAEAEESEGKKATGGSGNILGCIHIELLKSAADSVHDKDTHSKSQHGITADAASKRESSCCGGEETSSEKDHLPSAELGMFAVDPALQSQGIGSRLIKAAHAHAKDQMKCKSCCVWAFNIRKDIIGWYSKLGYKMTGEVANFPNSGGVGEKLLIAEAKFNQMRMMLPPDDK